MQSLLESSQKLIQVYEALSAVHKDLPGLPESREDVKGGIQSMQKLIDAGRNATKRSAMELLTDPSVKRASRGQRKDERDAEEETGEWEKAVGVKERGEGEESWARTVRRMDKGLRKMGKNLPED